MSKHGWRSLAATVKSRRYKADGTAEAPGGNGVKVLASDDGDETPDSSFFGGAQRCGDTVRQNRSWHVKMLKRWLLHRLHSQTGNRGMEAELRCDFTVRLQFIPISFSLWFLYSCDANGAPSAASSHKGTIVRP